MDGAFHHVSAEGNAEGYIQLKRVVSEAGHAAGGVWQLKGSGLESMSRYRLARPRSLQDSDAGKK